MYYILCYYFFNCMLFNIASCKAYELIFYIMFHSYYIALHVIMLCFTFIIWNYIITYRLILWIYLYIFIYILHGIYYNAIWCDTIWCDMVWRCLKKTTIIFGGLCLEDLEDSYMWDGHCWSKLRWQHVPASKPRKPPLQNQELRPRPKCTWLRTYWTFTLY